MTPERIERVEVYDASGRPVGDAPPQRGPVHARTWVQSGARAGVGMGSALAIAISWSQHQSILWAIVHGFLSWLYVGWYALTR